jgi:hypothetical protein
MATSEVSIAKAASCLAFAAAVPAAFQPPVAIPATNALPSAVSVCA